MEKCNIDIYLYLLIWEAKLYYIVIVLNLFYCTKAKFITEAEEKYDQLLKKLGPELSLKYQKRCEEATKEGNAILGDLFLY